jgi:hypothetical protein
MARAMGFRLVVRRPASAMDVVVAIAVTAFALLTARPVHAADVLVLRGGETRTGTVQSCDEEVCRLDGNTLARSGIAWIGFGQGGAALPHLRSAASDQVLLVAGAIERGSLTGLSLGIVLLGGSQLDRSAVAWIRLADPGAIAADLPPADGVPGLDLVLLRDGSAMTGELEGCAGGGCWLTGSPPLARAEVAAISFAGGGEVAAPGGELEADRVLLAGGGSRDGAVYGISSDDVVAVTGSYERSAVAAILFAATPGGGAGAIVVPSPDAGAGTLPEGAVSEGSPGAPGAPGSPGTPSAPSGSPGPRSRSGSADRERGALWNGSCHAIYRTVVDDCTHTTEVIDTVRVREYPRPILRRIVRNGRADVESVGTIYQLEPEDAERTNLYTLTCASGGGASGQGTIALGAEAEQEGYSHASTIWTKSVDDDLTPSLGYDFPRADGMYVLVMGTRTDDTYPVEYDFLGSEGHIEQSGYQPCWAGRTPLIDGQIDPSFRRLEGGRMIGQYTTEWNDNTVSASWTVCREGDACPPPPELPDSPNIPPDPCGRAGQQQAHADTCGAQLEALVEQLGPLFAAYNQRMAAANDNRDAFQEAQNYCALYDEAKEILEAILTGGTAAEAELAQSLFYLRDVIAKAANGDLGSLLYPPEVKKVLKAYKDAKNAWFELTADDLAKMNRDLGGCSGKMPAGTFLAAQQFLADLGAAGQLWHDTVAPRMNDLRAMGLECAYLDHTAWRACVADAECRGEAPDCGPEPSLTGAYDP